MNEPHDGHDDLGVHRRLENPSDAIRVQHEAVPVGLLIEERGW